MNCLQPLRLDGLNGRVGEPVLGVKICAVETIADRNGLLRSASRRRTIRRNCGISPWVACKVCRSDSDKKRDFMSMLTYAFRSQKTVHEHDRPNHRKLCLSSRRRVQGMFRWRIFLEREVCIAAIDTHHRIVFHGI